MGNNPPLVKIVISGYNQTVVYSNLQLEQHIGTHHYFKFNWSATDFKADSSGQFNVMQSYLGSSITISFENNNFTGIITNIAVDEHGGDTQSFTISGYSPTILLEDTPKCSSYYKKNLSDILNTVLASPPQGLSTQINPNNTDIQFYIVQYNETDFDFIQRLSMRFGEWFYYDGQNMVFGGKGSPDCDDLTIGDDLNSFRLTTKIRGLDLSFSGYDPFQGSQLSDSLPTVNGSGHNYHNVAAQTSNKIFSRQSNNSFHVPLAHNQQLLTHIKSLQTEAAAADLVEFNGFSNNTSLIVGYDVTVNNADGTLNNKYFLVSVTHFSTAPDNYSNSFVAIPSSVKVPPHTNPFIITKCDTQTAVVIDNEDPDSLGRIKIQFPWQGSNDYSPWIRIAQPHGGDGKGFYFIPEKNEEVLVTFEDGNVEKPLVVGTGYNGSAKPDPSFVSSSGNNFKVIQTREKNVIFFSDDSSNNKSILIANDSNKNQILLDFTNNQIIIKSQGDIHIQADGNIELKAGQDINITADGNINIQAQKQMQVQSTQAMQLSTQDQYSLQATNGISINSDQGITMESVMDTDITADNNLNLEGTIQASLQGAQVQIEGEAQATIDAAMVMINS